MARLHHCEITRGTSVALGVRIMKKSLIWFVDVRVRVQRPSSHAGSHATFGDGANVVISDAPDYVARASHATISAPSRGRSRFRTTKASLASPEATTPCSRRARTSRVPSRRSIRTCSFVVPEARPAR